MTRALLLYNPVSGTASGNRSAVIDQVAGILRGFEYEVDVVATTHRGSAGEQTKLAVAHGAEIVFVCGGDGTIHDALQGIIGTQALLAPIPMGRGNALCRALKIPLDPLRAAAAYGAATVREVALSECSVAGGTQYFLLIAGAGPDGALMYRMLTTSRGRLGRWAYAIHALRLLLRGRFPLFRVRYCDVDGAWHVMDAVSAMALRTHDLGGVFPGVGRGASLFSGNIRLVLVRAPGWLGLPLWFVSAWLRLERWNPLLVRADVVAFECDGEAVHAQVDGEWVGQLPFTGSLTRERVRLLVPGGTGDGEGLIV